MASVCLGLVTFVCFMASTLPQFYESYRTGNMDSALSFWFLLLWLGGASCNLLGSILANQLPLQMYTAAYFVCCDVALLIMYCYYKIRNKRAEDRQIVRVVGVACVLSFTSTLVCLPGPSTQEDIIPSGFKGRTLLSIADVGTITRFTSREVLGFSLGSLAGLLYLCSRGPQIYTNYNRKSTEGVSYFLFALTMLGNVTYGLSILLKNPEQDQGEASYLVHHLPWLIDSFGSFLLDIFKNQNHFTQPPNRHWPNDPMKMVMIPTTSSETGVIVYSYDCFQRTIENPTLEEYNWAPKPVLPQTDEATWMSGETFPS